MAFVIGGYVLINRRSLEATEVARVRLRNQEGPEKTWRLLKEDKISDVPFLNRLLSGRTWIEGLSIQLMQAGSNIKPVSFLLILLTSGMLGILLGGKVSGFGAVIFMIMGWGAPFLWLRWRQRRRVLAF